MLARPATLKDPGTPDQIGVEQRSLTHFPSQPWCKMCVESRGRDSPQRDQSKIDADGPQLQFDYGYMGDGGPLQIACFLVGTDTFTGAIHATTVPDPKKMGLPMLLQQQSVHVTTLFLSAWRQRRSSSVAAGQSGNRMSFGRTRLANSTISVTDTAEKAMSTVRGLARTYLAVLKGKISSFEVTTHSPMLSCLIVHRAWIVTRYNVRRGTRMTPHEKIRGNLPGRPRLQREAYEELIEARTLPRFIEIPTAPTTKNPKSETFVTTPSDAEQSTKRVRQEETFREPQQTSLSSGASQTHQSTFLIHKYRNLHVRRLPLREDSIQKRQRPAEVSTVLASAGGDSRIEVATLTK